MTAATDYSRYLSPPSSAPPYIPAFNPAPAPPKPSALLRKLTSRIGRSINKSSTPPPSSSSSADQGPSLADVRRAAALQARGLLPASQRYSTVFDPDVTVTDEFGRGRSNVAWVEKKAEGGEDGLSAAEVIKRDYECSRSRSASRTPAPVHEQQEEEDGAKEKEEEKSLDPVLSSPAPLSPSRLPSLSPTTSTAPSSSTTTSLRTPSAERPDTTFSRRLGIPTERRSSLSSADVSEESSVPASSSLLPSSSSSYQPLPTRASPSSLVQQQIIEEEESNTRPSTIKPTSDSSLDENRNVPLSTSSGNEKRKALGLFSRRKGVNGLPQIRIPNSQSKQPQSKQTSLSLSPSFPNLRKVVLSSSRDTTTTANNNKTQLPIRKPQFRSFTTPPESSSVPAPVRKPRVPLSPTMHSRSSIYVGTFGIEDDESRRLAEMAFLDM